MAKPQTRARRRFAPPQLVVASVLVALFAAAIAAFALSDDGAEPKASPNPVLWWPTGCDVVRELT